MTINGDLDSNGALDIARGGTNATTAAGARTALDVYSQAEVEARLRDPISITLTSAGDTNVLNPYSLVWTLTVLRIVHGYGLDYLPTYTIMDADGVEFIAPKRTRIDANTIDIDFGITITGTWSIMLSTGGIGGRGGVGAAGTITEASLASVINSATSKETPIDADELPLWDSAIVGMKKLTWANLKATLETYFDTLYGAGTGDVTLSGNNAFTGNNTHSGTETFTGSVTMAISSVPSLETTGRNVTSADFGKTIKANSVSDLTFPLANGTADNQDIWFEIESTGDCIITGLFIDNGTNYTTMTGSTQGGVIHLRWSTTIGRWCIAGGSTTWNGSN